MATSDHVKLEPDHLKVIEALAEEINLSVEEVTRIYASAYERLKTSARVLDYLSVLASKKVRDELHD